MVGVLDILPTALNFLIEKQKKTVQNSLKVHFLNSAFILDLNLPNLKCIDEVKNSPLDVNVSMFHTSQVE